MKRFACFAAFGFLLFPLLFVQGSWPAQISENHEEAPILLAERQALIELYKATDGEHWTHRDGWLGARGTECNWYGVTCASNPAAVTSLMLYENNMSGAIPDSLKALNSLQDLNFYGNHLSGRLPAPLLQLAHASSGRGARLKPDCFSLRRSFTTLARRAERPRRPPAFRLQSSRRCARERQNSRFFGGLTSASE